MISKYKFPLIVSLIGNVLIWLFLIMSLMVDDGGGSLFGENLINVLLLAFAVYLTLAISFILFFKKSFSLFSLIIILIISSPFSIGFLFFLAMTIVNYFIVAIYLIWKAMYESGFL